MGERSTSRTLKLPTKLLLLRLKSVQIISAEGLRSGLKQSYLLREPPGDSNDALISLRGIDIPVDGDILPDRRSGESQTSNDNMDDWDDWDAEPDFPFVDEVYGGAGGRHLRVIVFDTLGTLVVSEPFSAFIPLLMTLIGQRMHHFLGFQGDSTVSREDIHPRLD